MIDISIIIINYNSFELVSQTLESYFKFSNNFQYEIIIVDNGSSDGSLQKLKQRFPDVKFIENGENLGFAKANNRGLQIAEGKNVLFLNNDIIFLENSLKIILDYTETVSEDYLIGARLLNKDRSVQFSVYDFPSLLNTFTSYFFLYLLFPRSKYFNKSHLVNKGLDATKDVEVVTGAFMFAAREKLLKLGGFDEDFFFYGEDTDLCFRVVKTGGRVIYYTGTEVVHLRGSSTKSNKWFTHKNRNIARLKLFKKHFSTIDFSLAIIIHYLGTIIRIPLNLIFGLILLRKDYIMRSYYYFKILFILP